MKIGLLTAEQYHGKRKNWAGSSRIRGRWITSNWPDAEIFKMGQKYEGVIYQKAYWVEHAKNFKGKKILDMCDPDWLHWGYRVKEMIEEIDVITTSSEALAESVRKFTDKPVYYVPDRMDLKAHRGRKFHQGRAKWAVWFGYSSGFEMLKPILHFLKKYDLDLIVIAETGFSLPASYNGLVKLKNFPWSIDTVNNDMLMGDIVLNPQSRKGKWKYKSNNKTLSAWALGLPVAHNVEELERFLEEESRQEEAKKRLDEMKDKWDVKISVEEYKKIFDDIKK